MYPYLPLEIVTDSSGNHTSFVPLSAFYLGEYLTSNFACPKIQFYNDAKFGELNMGLFKIIRNNTLVGQNLMELFFS